MIEKKKLIAKIAKSTKISTAKAQKAYEIILKEGKAFRQQAVRNVKTKEQVAVPVTSKTKVKKVELKREVPVVKTKEVVKTVRVIKEVPVIQYRDRVKEVKVIKEVPVEVIKEITLVNEVEKKVLDTATINNWKKKNADAEKLAAFYKSELADAEKDCTWLQNKLKATEKDRDNYKKQFNNSKKGASGASAKLKSAEKLAAFYKSELADAEKDCTWLQNKLKAKPKTITKTVVKKVPVVKTKTVIKKVPVTKIKKVIKKVPVIKTVIKKVPVTKIKTVIKKVPVVKTKTVIKKVPVVKTKTVVKKVPVTKIKTVIKKVPVVKTVTDTKAIASWKNKYNKANSEAKKYAKEIASLKKQLSAKPKEVVREVEVVKSFDMNQLQKMMAGMGTVQVSRKVIGETRTKKDAKIVQRREVKAGTNKKDDLKRIEGVGPKIQKLLSAAGINTYKKLAKTDASAVRKILDAAGPSFKLADPGSWKKQADLAAKGKWAELKVLQDKLTGGR